MKDVYPQTNIWPYLLVASALFGQVLSPYPLWPKLSFEEVRQYVGHSTTPQAQRQPLVVLHDPWAVTEPKSPQLEQQMAVEQEIRASSPKAGSATFEPLANLFPPVIADESVEVIEEPQFDEITPTTDALRRSPTSVTIPTELDRVSFENALASQMPSAAVGQLRPNPASRRRSVSVWQPPSDWIPRPIQPLTDGQTMPTRRKPERPVEVQPRETPSRLVRVENQPPVATMRVRMRDRIPLEIHPDADRSAITDPAVPSAYGSIEPLKPEPQPTPDSRSPAPNLADLVPLESSPYENKTNRAKPIHAEPNVARPTRKVAERDCWPAAEGIVELLATAKADPVLGQWALAIGDQFKRLEGTQFTGTNDQLETLRNLKQLADYDVDRQSWPAAHRKLHSRVRHAVRRRVDIWTPLSHVARTQPSSPLESYRAWQRLTRHAGELHTRLATNARATTWSEWLGLASLGETRKPPAEGVTEFAETMLGKMHSADLTSSQLAFLNGPTFSQLESELRNVIARSVRPSDVIKSLEAYEASPDREHGNEIIGLMARWRSAPDNQVYLPTINAIVAHYRNANLRLSISEDLINRFVPAMHEYAEAVNDTILGAAVKGNNATSTRLSVALIPDPNGIRLGLLANGNVQSNTTSRKGPVRMYNRSDSTFAAGKQVIVRPEGIRVTATELRAETGNRMLAMKTDWDGYPIIGWLVRNMARQQHAEQRPRLRSEILQRVRRSASQKIDNEVAQRVTRVEQRLDERLVSPLRQLDLDPRAMEMRTTQDRAIIRTRLASPWQFGSHTPRPEALTNSKMSVQVHQTAPNNWIEQLKIQGKRGTLSELFAAISARFDTELTLPDEKYADTIVEFAAHHPFEFEFADGQIMVTLHFAELNTGKRKWKNFSVRGCYRADIQKLDLELIRDSGIELISERLRLRDQIALRSIFTKVFAKSTRLAILRKAIQQQPQLSSLVVTQLTIRDGWISLALGEDARRMRLVEKSTGIVR